jgi:hypothetical protein
MKGSNLSKSTLKVIKTARITKIMLIIFAKTLKFMHRS